MSVPQNIVVDMDRVVLAHTTPLVWPPIESQIQWTWYLKILPCIGFVDAIQPWLVTCGMLEFQACTIHLCGMNERISQIGLVALEEPPSYLLTYTNISL